MTAPRRSRETTPIGDHFEPPRPRTSRRSIETVVPDAADPDFLRVRESIRQRPSESPRERREERLRLHHRAAGNLRRHVLRALLRAVVLAVGDVAAFVVVRAFYRAVRDSGVLGDSFGGFVARHFPGGFLNGSQYAVALLLGLLLVGTYGAGDRRRNPALLLAGVAVATALPLWSELWQGNALLAIAQHLSATIVVWLGLCVGRTSIDRGVQKFFRRHPAPVRTLLIGSESVFPVKARPTLLDSDDSTLQIVGTLKGHPVNGVLGSIRDLGKVLEELQVDAVLLTERLSDDDFRYVAEVTSAAGCALLAIPQRFHLAGVWPRVVWMRGQPLVQLSTPSLQAGQLALKRAFDLVAASVGVVLISPLLVIVGIVVMLTSPGPIFFRQERVGAGGSRFRLWKFRTMHHGASDAVHRELVTKMLRGDEHSTAHVTPDGAKVYKLHGDTRVTAIGRFLRRTSLDELPQLINVIRGEMSLVGPRPPLPYEVAEYEGWELERLQVRPGITGLWQVSGRSNVSYRQMCELDLEYVRQWSFWLDVTILLRTLPVVLTNAGRAA
jgi:exopolysaccharide biosynthesis polyprenyl glycosylphosphotransferase